MPTTETEGTSRAAQAVANRLIAAGFPKEDVRVLGPDARTANLVARLRGRNPRTRPVLLMAHIDVVPARREDWSLDPWTLTERDGWFYGRGTHDNKAGAAMLVANFIRLKREGWQPERDLIILLTGDEETTQRSIQWLLAEHRALVDAELAFNTDGGGVMTKGGRPVFFDVQASEKIYADYQLEVTDPGGSQLARARRQSDLHSVGGARRESASTSSRCMSRQRRGCFWNGPRRPRPARPRSTCARSPRSRRIWPPPRAFRARPFYNANLRTTCVATRVDAGHANNALPQLARAVINCRILPGLPGAEVEAVIRQLAGTKVKAHRDGAASDQPAVADHACVAEPSRAAHGRLLARHSCGSRR